MAGEVELAKTNLYIGEGVPAEALVVAKTILYVGEATANALLTLSKTGLYIGEATQSGELSLAKTNLYISPSLESFSQFVTFPFTDNSDQSEFFGLGVQSPASGEVPRLVAAEIERNPYRTHLSSDPVETADDLREQQRIIRHQHDMIQAGDSTFDWGLLYETYPNKLFNLGSLGRFFDEKHGIVIARFVQFRDMVEHPWQGQPLGRLKFNASLTDWKVTNNLEKSDPDLIAGFGFYSTTPANDRYGWMVVQGANPAPIRVIGERVPDQNEPYTWVETGGIGLDESGTILGRRWGTTKTIGVPSGSLFIGVEGRSDTDLAAFIRDRLADDLQLLQTIKEGLEELGVWRQTINTSISALQAMDETLLERIRKEEIVRGREIQAIRSSTQIIDVDAKILQATITLRNEFGAADQVVFARADQAYLLAESVQLQLQALDLSGLDGISGVAEAIAAVNVKFDGLRFDATTTPVEDGQVFHAVEYAGVDGAPNYFVLEPIDYALNNLTDVDTTLLAAGTSPVWDGTDYIFLELARASNSIVVAPPLEITIGGDLGDPTTIIVHQESGVTADTYGDSTHVPVITVDEFGHVTDVTLEEITGGGGGGTVEVEDSGSSIVSAASILNFTGAGVTVTDAGSGQADIDIPGGGGGGGGSLAWTNITTWEFSVDGIATTGIIGAVGSYNEIRVIFEHVSLAGSGWRNVFLSTDGGSTYFNTSGDYQEVPASGSTSNQNSIFTHSGNTSAIRTGSVILMDVQNSGRRKWANGMTRGDTFIFIANGDPITHVMAMGWNNSGSYINMTGGRVYIDGR